MPFVAGWKFGYVSINADFVRQNNRIRLRIFHRGHDPGYDPAGNELSMNGISK
jgi:hypothetical protein